MCFDTGVTTIGDLLATAATDPAAEAWDDLFEQVRHTGVSDSEKALLLERLPAIAGRFAPAGRDGPLFLAGQLAADLDEDRWPRFHDQLTVLRALAADWLGIPDDAFLYRLQAAVALEGDELWGAELQRIDYGEIELECPHCGTDHFITLGEDDRFATRPDTGLGNRLHQLSMDAGRAGVATRLTYLFGHATCPDCGTTFRLSDQVQRN